MQTYKNNYFTSDSVKADKIKYGFFSKKGGYSTGNYHSLNCSISSGDKEKLVKKISTLPKKNLASIITK